MDPNAALAAIRQAVDELRHESSTLAVHQLVENSRALDEWLSKGGLLPDAWILADPRPISEAEHADDVRTVIHAVTSPELPERPIPWWDADAHAARRERLGLPPLETSDD